ncbi:MAG: NADH-quinone oxidoreductase subunit C [Armatimonadetes bacterium]|nr:NADH-quinone oxidoreductase subunit C [Armatimonadota bacterium]
MNQIDRNFKRISETPNALAATVRNYLQQPGRRFGHLTARVCDGNTLAIQVLLLDTNANGGVIITVPLVDGETEYPSVTLGVPAAHWAERAMGDLFGLRALDHPRWKSLILHDGAWPNDLFPLSPMSRGHREPYQFLEVTGEGIHEIPVGPIHAGIIEPGHFRFSCAGEIITNLDIRLGYQHRGIEKRLTELPWQQACYLAESASTDTAIGNALAHAIAMEQLLSIDPPPRAHALRTIALEFERLANHIGDIGALSGDIGYSAGAALFPPMRGAILTLAQMLTGSRRQRYYIKPGGVARDLDDDRRRSIKKELSDIETRLRELIPLVLENSSVLERMDGTGRITRELARDFNLVGPAGRASGSDYDTRRFYPHGVYPKYAPKPALRDTGDVLARAQIRVDEIGSSIHIVNELLESLPAGPIYFNCQDKALSPDDFGIGIVEAWRGELIHWITTDTTGAISRYAIKDPSFNNWTGLAIAARGNLVTDFPLCNKSFNLSYSGNDL